MTTSTPATPAPSAIRRVPVLMRVAAVLAALLAIADVLGTVPYLGNPMPIVAGVAVIVLAALTVIGAAFAFLGRPWGAWVAAVTRFLSIGFIVPIFILPGAPTEAVAPGAIQLVVTVIVIVLLLVGLRRRA